MSHDPIQQMKLNEMKKVVELAERQDDARDWLDKKVRERFGKEGQVLPLEFFPSEMLKAACKPVPVGAIKSKLMKKLSSDMTFTMYMCGGIGLAAPQVGLDQRFFVIDWSADRKHPVTCINPELIAVSEAVAQESEACLSMPGVKVRVIRPLRAQVAFYDLNAHRVEVDLEGWAARAYMHELDHLNGKMMFEHSSVHRIERRQALKKADDIRRGERPVKRGRKRR